ncbi:FAD-dependent oxidoreductase [Pelomonas cellulosilytica]|uniref:FAD-dependent oxidoreductase n=1 Tax=Pelomonas cellulosilytica TaxID=2906762 RepID=A0ABS8Y3J6_9BURK|nr:FAD-dependent oxidoreductase [Pelomonas sp. P8]MCE4556590.1 FAD-dependent oxidoreductase [Pelomonas sp. P8]
MTSPVRKILIIGGGFSGMAAAIQCALQGLEVDLVEVDPNWRSYGAGISIGGATLRALGTLGVLPRFLEVGSAHDGAQLFTAQGQLLAELPTPRVAGADVPGGGAIMRPALAALMADAVRAGSTRVRLGCSFTHIEPAGDGVDVAFTDGTRGRYDLVVGADGLNSSVRKAVFPDAPVPRYSGQGVWRAVLPRPEGVNNTMMWVGPKVKTGVNPVSKTEMYLFVTEDRPVNERVEPERFVPALKALLEPFSAPLLQQIRESLGPDSRIIYRPLEGLLVPQPWYRGRVVLIGDTVHATTPHLASGACIGIEDGIVLAEELGRAASTEVALRAFQQRRWERCRMVVENSARLGEIEIASGDKAEHARIMRESMIALAQPI